MPGRNGLGQDGSARIHAACCILATVNKRLTVLAAVLLAGTVAACADTRLAPAPRAAPAERGFSTSSVRRQQECMALALYWEARGEGYHGMEAVGWTILNRVRSPLFPATPCEVIYQGGERPGCQFSWYCDGQSDRPADPASWRHAMLVAGTLLVRPGPDPTGGALFFHATSIGVPWRRPRVRTAQIGDHIFYR